MNDTPKTNAFKERLPEPSAVQEMLHSHADMERTLHAIARLTKGLHDSPKSFQEHMMRWATDLLANAPVRREPSPTETSTNK